MKLFSILILTFPLLLSCKEKEGNSSSRSEKIEKKDTLAKIPKQLPADTVFYLKRNEDSIKVQVLSPANPRGTILILHGWNLPQNELCEKTTLCHKALDSGYVLIVPDFGKTTYQNQNYPQTKKSYLEYPTRYWIKDTFITALQKEFNLLLAGGRNFVYGVSTGGRGAALLALELPEIFKAAACLSADFDHSLLKDEPINNGYYGPIKQFPERWTGEDNIYNRAAEFENHLFLAHGALDRVCPVSQTIDFAYHIKKVNESVIISCEIDPKGDHTYAYWEKNTGLILLFFNKF